MLIRTAICPALVCACVVLSGCLQARPSAITPGAAKKHIKRGETSQAAVIEVFGTPNIITMRDGYEMWVYDKVSSRQTRAAFGIGGGGAGWGTGGGGAGGLGAGTGATTRSETTVMLIIYFGEGDVVSDYKITQTKF